MASDTVYVEYVANTDGTFTLTVGYRLKSVSVQRAEITPCDVISALRDVGAITNVEFGQSIRNREKEIV